MNCPHCHAPLALQPVCPSCSRLLERAPGATHFDLFSLSRGYAVDAASLDKSFRELSLKVHPDRFAKAEPRERRLSLELTSALNEAYKTLRDPVRRAFYLLKLCGIDLDREDGSTQKNMPLPFLEEVMELREALHEASLEGAQHMAADVKRRQDAALAEGVKALEAEQLEHASFALGRVRYFTRFLEEVAAREEAALG